MDLFRKSALQRMLSPEQLDQLIQISKPRDWIALIGICIILVVMILWSVWGSITIELPGNGILIKPGGYRIIQSPVEGQITKITAFQPGDYIQAGQVIAEVSQPVLLLQIESKKELLANLEQQEKLGSTNLSSLNEQTQLKIAETKSQLHLLQNEWLVKSKILSPYSGSFLAMRTSTGIYIKPGDSILSLEDSSGKTSAIIFLPPTTTNNNAIKPGMLVKIFTGIEKNTENGYIIGQVSYVSKFPASPQVMTNMLNNEYLVKFFFQEGPPYLVYVDLMPDPQTKSGYKWSSPSGKSLNIMSGTLCSALIQVESQSPINFLIPNLKKVKE